VVVSVVVVEDVVKSGISQSIPVCEYYELWFFDSDLWNEGSPVKSWIQEQKISFPFLIKHEPPFLHMFVGHSVIDSFVVVVIVVVVSNKLVSQKFPLIIKFYLIK
jgi:hypothetical protein